MSVSPSRRRLLQAAMLAPVAVACTPERPDQEPAHPDVALRAAAIAREQALIQRYLAAAASSASAVAGRIAGLAEEHAAHLAALEASSPGFTPTATPSAGLIRVPTLAQLVAAERAAAAAHAADALKASRSLAAVLATLAASEASHVVALT